mgnify:CR=1 FL=1
MRINLTKKDILSAIKEVNKTGIPSLRHSKDYSLLYENIHYPPKYLIGLANEFKNGIELDHNEFHGGEAPGAANNFLRKLGFKIVGGGTHEYKTLLKPKDVFTNNELMKYIINLVQLLNVQQKKILLLW